MGTRLASIMDAYLLWYGYQDVELRVRFIGYFVHRQGSRNGYEYQLNVENFIALNLAGLYNHVIVGPRRKCQSWDE